MKCLVLTVRTAVNAQFVCSFVLFERYLYLIFVLRPIDRLNISNWTYWIKWPVIPIQIIVNVVSRNYKIKVFVTISIYYYKYWNRILSGQTVKCIASNVFILLCSKTSGTSLKCVFGVLNGSRSSFNMAKPSFESSSFISWKCTPYSISFVVWSDAMVFVCLMLHFV